MQKVKSKKVYSYDYPENRELAKGLHLGDLTTIARLTGYTVQHISDAFKGNRKMPPNAYLVAQKLIEANREKDAMVAAL